MATKAEAMRRPLGPACARALRWNWRRQRSAMNGQDAIHPIAEAITASISGDMKNRPPDATRNWPLRDAGQAWV